MVSVSSVKQSPPHFIRDVAMVHGEGLETLLRGGRGSRPWTCQQNSEAYLVDGCKLMVVPTTWFSHTVSSRKSPVNDYEVTLFIFNNAPCLEVDFDINTATPGSLLFMWYIIFHSFILNFSLYLQYFSCEQHRGEFCFFINFCLVLGMFSSSTFDVG